MKKNLAAFLAVILFVLFPMQVNAFKLKNFLRDAAKTVGITILIDKMSDELNSFINEIVMRKGYEAKQMTKVVPIVRIGRSAYIGAAQVAGPKDAIAKVKAVLELDADFHKTKAKFKVKIMIPIDSKNPLKGSRVDGVGVSAIIEGKI